MSAAAALLLAGVAADPGAVPPAAPPPTAPAPVPQDAPATPAPAQPAPDAPVTPPPVIPAAPQAPADVSDIVVTGPERVATPGDPMEQVNAQSYKVTQAVDDAVVAPVAKAYKGILPRPIRSGLRNFVNNLNEPVVFVNYLLQLKPGKAAETLGRFAVNSTVGVAGVFDMAKRKPFKLPLRRNGFANTMGYYGIKPGPYLYLPLVGPTTVRDLFGLGLDRLLVPVAVGKPFDRPYYAIPVGVLGSLDYRIEFDDYLRNIRESRDPYAAARETYLKAREAEIEALHGRVVPPPVILREEDIPRKADMPETPAPDATPPAEAAAEPAPKPQES